MTDNDLREMLADLIKSQVKTDAQLAKTDAQLAKTDAKLDRLSEKLDKLSDMYGGVGNNQGKVAEEFYYNSLKDNPVLNGIRFDFVEKNVTRSSKGMEEEYDLLLINGEAVYVIEVKYRLHPDDIDKFIGKKARHFKMLYPEYANYQIYFAMAAFSVEDDVKNKALEHGVHILQRRGEVIETLAA